MESGLRTWVRGRSLGRGADGEVHLAAAEGRRFAVKSAPAARAAPLMREFEILSTVRSAHVVACLGAAAAAAPGGGETYNLFLEYAPGGSLAETAAARRRLGALADLHSAGVVHCDVKGENALVCGGGRVKLADFGCAARGGRAAGAAVAGTPLFMAPEVARGEGQGPEADVWALGCTVVEMVTGRPPWPEAADPVAALHLIGFSGETPKIPAWLSASAKDFLDRCLQLDPRRRCTAAELLAHPFVSSAGDVDLELDCSVSSPAEKKRKSSPKSILDQDQWVSWGESDDDDGSEQPSTSASAAERLAGLAGVSSDADDETWDENSWITVRNGVVLGGEKRRPAVAEASSQIENPQFSGRSVDFCAKICLIHESKS
ncbi:mitogen-activated protein kinase kinase kinase 17-like [Wolffia australiana]